MLRVLLDQDFNHKILSGLVRRLPNLDYLTALEIGLSEVSDFTLLLGAANEGRLLLTHDRKTMPQHIADFITAGHVTPGVVIASRSLSLRQAISELELIIACTDEAEWINHYRVLPF